MTDRLDQAMDAVRPWLATLTRTERTKVGRRTELTSMNHLAAREAVRYMEHDGFITFYEAVRLFTMLAFSFSGDGWATTDLAERLVFCALVGKYLEVEVP